MKLDLAIIHAWLGSCNHVEKDWLIPPVPAQQINGFQTTKTFNPWRLKTWTLVVKTFVSEGRKNDHYCRHQRRNIIPLVNKRIWKCLHWMILLKIWRILSWECIVFSSSKARCWFCDRSCSAIDWWSSSESLQRVRLD